MSASGKMQVSATCLKKQAGGFSFETVCGEACGLPVPDCVQSGTTHTCASRHACEAREFV